MRSAALGHHFAGYSNRFWSLLFEAKLIPERITYQDDCRLPRWGFGITNVVPRATPGIDTIERGEYVEGARALKRKIRRWRPRLVACVGVTVFRSLFAPTGKVQLGLQSESLAGAAVFVLPNPSGRNAHYSIDQMRTAFSGLRRHTARLSPP
jgi:TDG/mug DNA glycosylase family protein